MVTPLVHPSKWTYQNYIHLYELLLQLETKTAYYILLDRCETAE